MKKFVNNHSTSNVSHITVLVLVHFPDEPVDEHLSVAMVTTLNKVRCLLSKPTPWVVELERPKKIVGSFEVWSDGEDLMNKVLHTDDIELS